MQQVTLFDCFDHLQTEDTIRQQLEHMPVDSEIVVGELIVQRQEKFYIVCKGNEFEEPFKTVGAAYQFINHIQEW